MRDFLKIFFCSCALFFSGAAAANFAFSDSLGNNLFELEKKTLLQRIVLEKTRIAGDYKSADARFFSLADSVTEFILLQDIAPDRRNLFLKRLLLFFENINRYTSDSYFKNGTYLAVLSYYPVLIEWDGKDELLRNIKRYSNFSIKAVRLIPSDTVAEDFLTDYLYDHPDDIFRYADEFDDRKFALRLMERAAKVAPESAKRYFSSANPVYNILIRSTDPYIKKSFELYSKFGTKSRGYLLLDEIVSGKFTVEEADAIGNNPDEMFSNLVRLSMKYEANVTYSIYRYMDIYCIDAVRKISQKATDPAYRFEDFEKHSPEEMFVLISYGYKETSMRTQQVMFDMLQKKSTGVPISSAMITSLDKNKLKDMVIFCDRNQTLADLLSLVDDEKKDYLLALTTLETREDLFPPFKSFAKINPLTETEPQDKALNELTKIKNPKTVSPDTISDEQPLSKPEKEGTVKTEKETPQKQKPVKQESEVPETNKTELAMNVESKTDVVPVPVPDAIIEPIKIVLDDKTKIILQLKKNVTQTLQNIPSFINEPYAQEVLMFAAQKEPDELFKKIDQFKGKSWCLKILEACAYNAPVSVKRYLYNEQLPVNYILRYSNDDVVKKIFEVNEDIGYQSKPFLLLDDLVAGKMSMKDAAAVSAEPNKLFSAVIKIIARGKYIGKYSIDHEMRDYSLRFVREINDKIASGSSQPFYSVESFNSQELYFLMYYGRDEVFTSTFTGLFNRFIQKMPNTDGAAFLRSVNNAQFRDFLSLCSNFGVLENFLGTFDETSRQNLLTAYISNLETEKDNLSSLVLVAEAIYNLSDLNSLALLEGNIKKEFERVKNANDQIGISVYGVLSSIISGNAKTERSWYKQVSQQFQISTVSTLSSESLFNSAKLCVEQMYFYNDEDGRSSFINFMNTYKNQPSWTVEDHNSYVILKSKGGQNVEIYANKPSFEENGISAIQEYFKSWRLSPTVIVHRGHSFHTETTLEKVPSTAKLIFVGSCGGFYKISIALENAPEAHIISTKQVGTKSVNDAVVFALNEMIRSGKDIVWNEFWTQMKDKLGNNQYFRDYIPPHKNLEATFIKAYYKILGV